MKKTIINIKSLFILLTVGLLFVACGKKDSNKLIQIKGSDTILNLTQKVTETYLAENPKARISVTGGGSGTGISALLNKTVNIAMSSRSIKEEETKKAKESGINLKEITIGFDAISIIINKNNPVGNLTMEQLRDIYLGKVTNWKDIGGPDKKIIVISRDTSSGTHVYFKEHVLRNMNSKGTEEFGSAVLYLPSNESIKQQVNGADGAIGYLGLGYLDDSIKVIGINNVKPTVATVKDKTYPIARAVYWYTGEEMNDSIKQLVDFMLSDKGQKIVQEEGFVPVK